jgi:hypothetical protein
MRPLYVRRSKEGLCRTVRRFATGEKEVPVNQQGTANEPRQRIWYASAAAAAAAAATALGTYSLYLRDLRQAQIEQLPLASESGVFFINGTSNLANQNGIGKYGPNRDLTVLQSTVARAGLMGTSVKGAKSVKVSERKSPEAIIFLSVNLARQTLVKQLPKFLLSDFLLVSCISFCYG